MVGAVTQDGWIDELVGVVEAAHGEQPAAAARALIDGTVAMRLRQTHQPPSRSGAAFVAVIPGMMSDIELFALFAKGGRVAVQLKALRKINPFRVADQEVLLRERLAGIPGFKLDKLDYPDVTLTKLADPEARDRFVETMRWTVDKVRKSNGLS
jgi:hypothetical protein